MFIWQFLCQRLDTCMHRIACFTAFFALVAHGTLGCCAHHSHADERGGLLSLNSTTFARNVQLQSLLSRQTPCCHGHDPWSSARGEATITSLDSHNGEAACDHHGERGHKECHENPCVYVGPNKAPAASVLGGAGVFSVVGDDASMQTNSARADALPAYELLIPRSHFLNRTLLI